MFRAGEIILWQPLNNLHLQLEVKPGILANSGAGHLEGGVHGGQLDVFAWEGGVDIDSVVSSNTEPLKRIEIVREGFRLKNASLG